MLLCEQGDQGRLSGGGVEAGTLAGKLRGWLGQSWGWSVFSALDQVLAGVNVHRISDTIQPSHPLSPLSPPALNLSQHQGLFQ